MALEKSVDDFGLEQFAALGGAVAERIRQQSTERPAEPVVRGNIETDFLALQDGRRELVFHQFLEKHFLLRTADLQRGGEFGGKLDKAMIEKRRTHFDGVSHAHTVALRENVVAKKVFLIEPKVRREVVRTRWQAVQLGENLVQRIGEFLFK